MGWRTATADLAVYRADMAGTREAAVTKRAKILVATVAAAIVVGGVGPTAFAQERRSVGQIAYQQVSNAADAQVARGVIRLVQRAVDAAF